MSKLPVAEIFYNHDGIMGVQQNGTAIGPALWCNWRFTPAALRVTPTGDGEEPAARAYVNHGKWRVFCPFGCGSSQIAAETDHRFYCIGGEGGCQNAECGHLTIPVNWPDDEFRAELESLLALRPVVFQNWVPGETLEQIRAENQEHGLDA